MRRVLSFRRNRDGNVAMMWALMGTALIGLLGLTIDFTRAVMVKTDLITEKYSKHYQRKIREA